MGEHYFTERPASRRRPADVRVVVRGRSFTLRTDAGVFSRGRLDAGTRLLIEALDIEPGETLLDLGCGFGAIGIVAARLSDGGHVIFTDVNERAVALAKANLRANGVENAEVRTGDLYEPVRGMAFDHVACNPPIRAGRAVVDRIVSEAPDHLLDGGRLWLVVRTKLGAESIRDRMVHAFGNADVVKRGGGYKVLRSRKATG
ncbi:MAG TPA: class I SAM-dependent methyltransferase [Thermoplasmata archaeon]